MLVSWLIMLYHYSEDEEQFLPRMGMHIECKEYDQALFMIIFLE